MGRGHDAASWGHHMPDVASPPVGAAYLELKKLGKVIARRPVTRETYPEGVVVKLGKEDAQRFLVSWGQIKRYGDYEARLIEASTTGDQTDADVPVDSGEIPSIEGYEILGKLGEGGGGTVWVAKQISTGRDVALKLLTAAGLSSDRVRRRFEREVELLAGMEHSNMAAVYDSGVHRGVYFYAMQLIPGERMDVYVHNRKLGTHAIVRLVRDVALAVQYAHRRGIIHRDLKPSNLIVTASGTPFIVDFGVAKTLRSGKERDVELTHHNRPVGTPAYMSPEQAGGDPDEIDTRTDVYSLGVVLYRLVVAKTPHDLTGAAPRVLRRIAEEEVRKPRDMNPQVDVELEAILLRALARDVDRRYASAGAFARDLTRYLDGEPIEARADSRLYVLRKNLRRHRVPVFVAALFVLFMTASLAAISWLYIDARTAHTLASDDRDRALTAQRQSEQETQLNRLLLSRMSSQQSDFDTARQWLSTVEPGGELAEAWWWAAWEYVHHSGELLHRNVSDRLPSAVQLPSAGALSATLDITAGTSIVEVTQGRYIGIDLLGTAKTVTDQQQLRSERVDAMHGMTLERSDATPDQMVLADTTGRAWTLERAPQHEISGLSVDVASGRLVIGYRNGLVLGYRMSSNTLVPDFTIEGYREAFVGFAFSADGTQLHSLSADLVYRVWPVQRRPDTRVLAAHEHTTRRLVFDNSGAFLASGSYDGSIKVWKVATGRMLSEIPAYVGSRLGTRQIAFSHEPDHLYSTGGDRFLSHWNWQTGKLVQRWPLDDEFSTFVLADESRIAFVRGGVYLRGETIQRWNLETGTIESRIGDDREQTVIYDHAYDAKTGTLFAALHLHQREPGMTSDCDLWSAETGERIGTLALHEEGLRDVDLSPNGRLLVLASRDGTASIWDWQSGEVLHRLVVKAGRGDSNVISSARFHPTRPVVVTASHDNRVMFWSTETGRELAVLSVDRDQELAYRTYGALKEAAFSPDGSTLAITVGSDIWLLDMSYYDERIRALQSQASAATN